LLWPESPARSTPPIPHPRRVSNIAREAQTWVLAGSLGIRNAGRDTRKHATGFTTPRA